MNAVTAAQWQEAQQAEREFWNQNDRNEHRLQQRFIAANLALGFRDRPRSVVDFGGGPMSLLLDYPIPTKHVVDPLPLTDDEKKRYDGAKIIYHQTMAENFVAEPGMFDEVWGYNCLQHVQVPGMIMETVRKLQPRRIRWFEWINVPVSVVHPHTIEAKWLEHELLRNAEYRMEFRTIGMHWTPEYSQDFFAMVVERVT